MSLLNLAAVIIGISIRRIKAAGRFYSVRMGGAGIRNGARRREELFPGDVVEIPAGVKHWHGAAKDSWFTHLAVEVPGENARSEWLEPVDKATYAALK